MVGSAAWAGPAMRAVATTVPRINRLRIALLLDGQGAGDRGRDAAVGGARGDAQPVAAGLQRAGLEGHGVHAGAHGRPRRGGGALGRAARAVGGAGTAAAGGL